MKNPVFNFIDYDFIKMNIDSLPFEKVTSNVVECAEENRILPEGTPFPGKYRYSKTPYLYEIAMCLSPQSPIETVHLMKSAQGGATTGTTENLILFKIMKFPGNVLALGPTGEFIQKWDEGRIMPMLEKSGAKNLLRSTYKKNTQHGGKGDATGRKTWPGGRLDIISFAQTKLLRNQSYDTTIIEEVDEITNTAQKGESQGDITDVAKARMVTYKGRSKMLNVSTPLVLQTSIIHKKFLTGDQRYYYVPCPKCGKLQRLEWKNLRFSRNSAGNVIEDSVYYECNNSDCHYHILNEDKAEILKCKEFGGKAKWIPHNAEKAPLNVRSYHFSALYYPPGFITWYDMAVLWTEAQGDPEKLQAFINLYLGEPFSDYSEAPPAETLHILKGNYLNGHLPERTEGCPIIAFIGADVQAGNTKDGKIIAGKEPRIEASLWGFGLHGRMWLLGHYIIRGEVTDYRSGAFAKFRTMITNNIFPVDPKLIFIDSGYQSDEVRKFCNGSNYIFPIKGDSNIKKGYFREVELQGFRSGDGSIMKMFELETKPIKRRIYNALGLRQDPATHLYPDGYMMFPSDTTHKYFEQLTAERPTPVLKNGKIIRYDWIAHSSNEALDCCCYAICAYEVFVYQISLLAGEETSNYSRFWDFALSKYGYQIPKVA